MLGTFGRGFYVLDDYSPLRGLTAAALALEAELLPLRHAYQYDVLNQQNAAWGNVATPNPAVRRAVDVSRRSRIQRRPGAGRERFDGQGTLPDRRAADAGPSARRLESAGDPANPARAGPRAAVAGLVGEAVVEAVVAASRSALLLRLQRHLRRQRVRPGPVRVVGEAVAAAARPCRRSRPAGIRRSW